MDNNPESPQPPEEGHSSSRPTHRIRDVKVGDYGVQLLVSTKDHVYDAETVEAGWNAWQVVGSWEEASVQQLASMLNQRQVVPNEQASEPSRFGNAYGTGKVLGTVDRGNIRTVRREESE